MKTEPQVVKKFIGIWIDHNKAFVVGMQNQEVSCEKKQKKETLQRIDSDVDRRTRLHGGSCTGKTPWGPQEVAVDRKIEERQKHQLNGFYDQAIKCMHDADKVLIRGTGEAKFELRKRIETKAKELAERIVDVESSDKMTEGQIAARVRSVFAKR